MLFLLSALWLALWCGETAAQSLVLSEFVASNSAGLRDEDGEFSDWIEIYNPGANPVNLGGWHLTDEPDQLALWTFPNLVLPGQGFTVVFASGKDRRDPNGLLHANFKLDREGEYLALIQPDGRTIASQFAPQFPPQITDVSYGLAMALRTEALLGSEAAGFMFVPTDDRLGRSWVEPSFVADGWIPVRMGVGFDGAQPGGPDAPEPPAPPADVTIPGDRIVGTSSNSPGGEEVDKAIDDNPRTKYLNFDKTNAGFTVTPAAGLTVVSGLRFTSANDAPDRDPTSYLLLGSKDGQAFVEVARGHIPNFADRFETVSVAFTNAETYLQYQLLFPTVRNAAAAVAVQIAEVELLGRAGPAPQALGDLISASVESHVYGRNSSVYLRFPFLVEEVRDWEHLALKVRYDDGFAAFLNGVEIARGNAPADLAYNSTALTNRSRAAAVREELYPLRQFQPLIRPGPNVLAVQGLNDRRFSADFLIALQVEDTDVRLGQAGYLEPPSPGRPNGSATPGRVAEPVFSPARGFYETPVEVGMTSATPGAFIVYTTDGSRPSATNGLPYAGPIRLKGTSVLRAIALREGWLPSRASTHSYFFLEDVLAQSQAGALADGFPASWNGQAADYGLDPRVVGPAGTDRYGGKYRRTFQADLQAVPTMSLVMNQDDLFGPAGLYSNPTAHGDAWERAASLELIDPAGQEGFQADGGIRIQGGAFRRFDLTFKKSFRMVFRDQYGSTTLRYPLFGPDAAQEFDNFVLRANSNDAWPYWSGSALYVRDSFAVETARAMGSVASHTRFVHLYINGLYWGLYNPVERPDAAFSASYFGGEKETWDGINQDSVPDGNYEAWNRLLAMLSPSPVTDEVYQRVQGNNPDGSRNPDYEDLLDVDNLIDYLILNFYIGNTDWPQRNWWVGRDRNGGDGFKFYPWDSETALGVTGLNVDRTGVTDAVARPYAALKSNAEFRMRFADHVYRHFYHGGALFVDPAQPAWDPARPESNQPAARFAALAGWIDRAIVGESARWGDQKGTGPFTRDEHWQRERDDLLTGFFPRRSAIVLEQFRRAGLYPQVDPPVMNQRGGRVDPGFELTLSAVQGTIYYTTNGADPRFPTTVQELGRKTLLSRSAARRVLIPSAANGGSQLAGLWRGGQEPFDDTSWAAGSGGVGYDQQTEYRSHIQFDVQNPMLSQGTSAFIRIPFEYAGTDQDPLDFLLLRVQYDDGFAAFLNGVRIGSANAPAELQWNSAATGGNPDASAVQFEEFGADEGLAALKRGRNVLAIHGLNVSSTSSDFLINVELIAGRRRVTTGTPTALRYTAPIALRDLTTIKARVFNGLEWSALNEATFEVGRPRLDITELHYHPADPTEAERAAGFADDDDFEFIELSNDGSGTCNLEGVRFVTGIRFDFTGSAVTLLPPGQSVLVVRNRAAFEQRYGPSYLVAGEYAGQLDNAGERIELVDARDQVLASFIYGTEPPWPQPADGDGPSLERADRGTDLSAPSHWQLSVAAGGTPGRAEPAPDASLRVDMIQWDENHIRLSFVGKAGLGYTVYARDSLAEAGWQPVEQGDPLAQDQVVEVQLPLQPSSPARFYRISVP